MRTVGIGRFLIAVSPDGETNWALLKPENVPEWLKNPDVMGAMVEGHIAHESADETSPWYCVVQVPAKADAAANEDEAESVESEGIEAGGCAPAVVVPIRAPVGVVGAGFVVDSSGVPFNSGAEGMVGGGGSSDGGGASASYDESCAGAPADAGSACSVDVAGDAA